MEWIVANQSHIDETVMTSVGLPSECKQWISKGVSFQVHISVLVQPADSPFDLLCELEAHYVQLHYIPSASQGDS